MSLSVAQFKSSRQTEAVKTTGLFPESMQTSSQNLIAFIEKYYEYLNSVGLPSYEIGNITTEKDIDLTSLEYLNELQNLIAKNIPQSRVLDKLTLYKIIFRYYHTRGSEDSIHSFFKIFFNQIVEIFYPKDFLFDLSNGSGEWGEFDPFSLRSITTNPNKKYMRVKSEIEISPKINLKGYDAKSPLLVHVKDNLWTQDGDDVTKYNVPYILRTYQPEGYYRWVYRYQDLIAISSNDDAWPDTSTWSTINRDFAYEEGGVLIPRDVNYEELNGDNRNLEFLSTISVTAVPERGIINEYVLSLSDNLIYKLISSNPTIWQTVQIDGKFWRYIDEKSTLSNRYVLQDSYYWQNYSYEIKSEVDSAEWLNQYFKFVHPSGLKLFTSLLLEFFNRNDWEEFIIHDSKTVNDTYGWLNSQRAPRPGTHAPKFQPGALKIDKLLTYILTVLRQQYVNVLGTDFVRDNFKITVRYTRYGVERKSFAVGDKISILLASDENLNKIHTITEVDTAGNTFSFIVDTPGPSALAETTVKIIKIEDTPPQGYKSYENLLCQILLKLLFQNINTREANVHEEYQRWLKFVDSTELVAGYLDRPIDEATVPYNVRNKLKFNNLSSYIDLEKNVKIVSPTDSNQFYPWRYSQIIKYVDDDGFFNTMYDTYIESYTSDLFESRTFNYNFSYSPEFIPPVISLTSPIISEDSFDIIYENEDTILLENENRSTPNITINTFEYILEDGNTRIFEDGDIKALTK